MKGGPKRHRQRGLVVQIDLVDHVRECLPRQTQLVQFPLEQRVIECGPQRRCQRRWNASAHDAEELKLNRARWYGQHATALCNRGRWRRNHVAYGA